MLMKDLGWWGENVCLTYVMKVQTLLFCPWRLLLHMDVDSLWLFQSTVISHAHLSALMRADEMKQHCQERMSSFIAVWQYAGFEGQELGPSCASELINRA